MEKKDSRPLKFNSLSDAHRAFGMPQPQHPLLSLLNSANVTAEQVAAHSQPHVLNFYKISYRPHLSSKLKYGQGYYDFDEGGLLFAAPNQIIGATEEMEDGDCSLYTVLIHPDFFLNYPMAKKIRQFGFFSYTVTEALHLSDREKDTILSIFRIIEEELSERIDEFSQDVVVAQIELLLNYANRFYKRQFITRKGVSSNLLQQLEALLDTYFSDDSPLQERPTVQALASQLNMSPSYLSDMLRALTGQNAQQHIHLRLIEKAKELLSTTNLTVSEVAYQLGFEHSQSFSKLFKTKTRYSPLEFRQTFNG